MPILCQDLAISMPFFFSIRRLSAKYLPNPEKFILTHSFSTKFLQSLTFFVEHNSAKNILRVPIRGIRLLKLGQNLDENNLRKSRVLHWEKNFFELKKVFLIQKNVLWSKEIDLFTLKKIFLNQQNFLQFKEILSLTV